MDLSRLFEETARRCEDRTALLFTDGESLTYRELDARATRLAQALRRCVAIRPGTILAIYADRSLDTVVAMLAAWKAGAAFAPIDPMYPRERVAGMLAECETPLVLTHASLADWLDRSRYAVLTLDVDLAPVLNGSTVAVECLPAHEISPAHALPALDPESLAYVIFTSGSTGQPKGCMIPHRAGVAFLRSMIAYPGLSTDDRVMTNASISFDMMMYEIFFPLAVGATAIMTARDVAGDGRRVADALERFDATAMMATPATWRLLIAAGWRGRPGFHLVSAGEALSPDLARELLQRSDCVYNMYGPTETTVIATVERVTSPDQAIAIGLPAAGTRMFIVDATGTLVADGDAGELWIGGPQVGLGYLNQPELTRERFVPNRLSRDADSPLLYRTGDLCRKLPDGRIDYLGRIDQQVKIRGFRIELGEIEAKLAEWPQIRWAVAIAREDAPGDKRLAAYVILHDGVARLDLSSLRRALAAVLPDYMVPPQIVVMDAFPQTASGKVDRKALPIPRTERAALAEPCAAPRDQLERDLVAVFAPLLQYDTLSIDDPLFDLGLNSLLVVRATVELAARGVDVSPGEIFQGRTIAALATLLRRQPEVAGELGPDPVVVDGGRDIAIVGMAGRFPGAGDLREFWRNLRAGLETTSFLAADAISSRIPDATVNDPAYVKARGLIGDVALFDAEFFGIGPSEAAMLDPQQRIFLEEAWHALEDAGYVPERCAGRIGVYAGANRNTYFLEMLRTNPAAIDAYGDFPAMIAAEKDFLATRVAHRLDLNGPAVSVQTACSTSLVAVIEAVGALRDNRCDMAIAGGVSIVVPQRIGHEYQEGSIMTQDGHCRPFAADATGTLWSDGVGVVVLKRLQDATRDGDHIYAVVKGVGINNDGGRKASFAAPSVDGQLDCLTAARRDAGVEPAAISYVEAHGTGTPIGDPIETLAIRRALVPAERATSLRIGSVKGNFGHTVAAAGVAGLIKTALAVRERELPPSIHCGTVNPACGFDERFAVQTALTSWRVEGGLLAGVSSFGVGGTNAHVVVGEAPATRARGLAPRFVLLPVAARSPRAWQQAASELSAALAGADAWRLADAAWTNMSGRRAHAERGYVVVDTTQPWDGERLAALASARVGGTKQVDASGPAVWMFPGQGAQYPGMARSLYEQEPVFRRWFDAAATRLLQTQGIDLVELVLRAPATAAGTAELSSTRITQPAIFAISHALAQLWLALGLRPAAMLGHSLGEFVAAVIGGVMRFEDALDLVAARGALLESLPRGDMLAVRAGVAQVRSLLVPGCTIAAINGPSLVVVAGEASAVALTDARLRAAGLTTRALATSHAFHTAMMQPAVAPMTELVAQVELREPTIRIYSSVTGRLLGQEARDPAYWGRHVVAPVDFAAAVQAAAAEFHEFLEVGPRGALSQMTRQILASGGHQTPRPALVLTSLSVQGDPELDAAAFLDTVGKLWQRGDAIDWRSLGLASVARRCSLPGYPFERRAYWNLPDDQRPAAAALPAASPPSASPLSPASTDDTTHPQPETETSPMPRLEAELIELFEELSGIDTAAYPVDTSFFEMGMDSLALTQIAVALSRRYKVKLGFRDLLERQVSIRQLAAHLASTVAPAKSPAAAPAAVAAVPAAAAATSIAAAPISSPAPLSNTASSSKDAGEAPKPFGAIARITRQAGSMTPSQRALYERLLARYTAKTNGSKAHTQTHRATHADPRAVTGFRPEVKELIYPLVMQRSKGAYLWDVDGNRYVDLTCGFGSNFFGNMPDWLHQRLVQQLDDGIEIGPQHHLAGVVADKLTRYLGCDRVAFCNTGSEAILGALRIARTTTGRSKIISFTGSYHGIIDEVIVRAAKSGKSYPAAPGIMDTSVANIEVLDYGTDASLARIRDQADDVAAILVESVQSRRPDFRPKEFLQELRRIADASGAVLIIDEIITGFRTGRHGAQGYYGVQADLATYGKVIGAGVAIGVIGGKRHLMDALDGGAWQYGDTSAPEVGVTYFAGTFVRHPLALAAMDAVMDYLAAQPEDLAARLMARADAYVARMNAMFTELRAPFRYVNHGSMMKLNPTQDLPNLDILVYLLRDKGIHTWDGFPNFFTLAHTDEDIAVVERSFREALIEMADAGFYEGGPPAARSPARVAAPAVARGERTEAAASAVLPAVTLPAVTLSTTAAQREIWAACQLSREASLAYNESVTLTISGAIDAAAMLKALAELRARHESLRMRFAADGETLTIATRAVASDRVLPLGDDDEALARLKAEAVAMPFDLGKGPLFRADVLPGERQSHVIMTAHHLVCDGWSTAILIRDLSRLYSAQLEARPAYLPTQQNFRDFAARQTAVDANGQTAAADLAYWEEQYRASAPTMDMPHDLPRPRQRSFASRRLDVELPATTIDTLRKLAARDGASLFMALLAAYKTLLWKLLDDDVVVAIPAAGQAQDGWYDLVGHCVSTLPIKSMPRAEQSFRALLRQVKAAVLDGSDHQSATFGGILASLPIARDPSRIPLAPILFNVDKQFDMSEISFGELGATYDSNPRVAEAFEIFHNITEANGTARLECQFNTDLYSDEWIRSHIDAYITVLQAVAADPDQALARLTWAPAAQLATRQADWQSRRRPLPATSLVALIDAAAQTNGDSLAIKAVDGSLSYAQLVARANQWARLLAAAGVGRGQRVGVAVERKVELLPVLLGILKAGAAYVPLDPGFPRDRLSYMIEHSGLRVVVTESAVASRLPAAACHVILSDRSQERLAALPADAPATQAALTASDIAYVIYTSGSTGKPKGVEVTHAGVVNFLASMRQQPGIKRHDRLLAVTTLSFDIAVLELYLPLVAGATVVLATREQALDGFALARLIDDAGINMLQATPATWRMLVDAGWQGGRLTALCGGEALGGELVTQLLPRVDALWNMYGPTETTVWSTCRRIESADRIDIGQAIDNTSLHVVDRHGQPVPWGVPGELLIGGIGVAAGYLRRPDLTAERFVNLLGDAGRVYRTGDLVRMAADGRLHYLRRNDNQVKLRGFRIELGEVESVLASQVGVKACVAIVREDRPGDQRLTAYCEGDGDARSLTAAARTALPGYMVPQHVVVLPQLPRLPNGKIDRKALPPPSAGGSLAGSLPSAGGLLAGSLPSAGGSLAGSLPSAGSSSVVDPLVSPAASKDSSLAAAIAAIWGEMLGLTTVPRDVSFYALGGHSLLAIRMLQALQQRTGKTVGLASFLEHNTIQTLAAQLDAGGDAPAAAIPRVSDGRSGRASLMQERIYFLERFGNGDTANVLPDGRRILGAFDAERFLDAVRQLVQRHALLRARFVDRRAAGVGIEIADRVEWDDQIVDLGRLPAAAQAAEVERIARRIATTPMRLDVDPLFRFQLIRLASDAHVVLTAFHHIIWDGWSFDIFWNELHTLYHAASRGVPAKLPPLSVDYLDFAAWHRGNAAGATARSQLAFWKDYLADLDVVRVPTDDPTVAERQGVDARRESRWSAELVGKLEAIGRSEGTTTFVVMLALYQYLLARRSGQLDIQVGTPVQGRDHPEVGGVIGDFVNLLVVRAKLSDGIAFRQWVRVVRQALEAAMTHQAPPFEEILRVTGMRGKQLCQSQFSYQDTTNRRTDWLGSDQQPLAMEQISLPMTSSGADLFFWMRKSSRGVDVGFDFRIDLFHGATIVGMLEEIEHLAKLVANDADLPLVVGSPLARDLPVPAAAVAISVNDELSAAERRLATIWREVLGTDAVGRHDNFFDLGGHSLLLLPVVSQIEAETGRRVPITLFLTETLAAIAPHCGFGGEPVSPAPTTSTAPLSTDLHGGVPEPVKQKGWRELMQRAFGVSSAGPGKSPTTRRE